MATVSITITPIADAPIANDQSITTPEDVAKAITLVGSDPDGNAITYIIVSGPSHGTLSGTAPNVTYTPTANYNGPDSFTFKVNDGTSDSNIATVSITVTPVGDAPVASNQSITTPEDVAKAFTLVASDPDGDALTYIIISGPSHGTLSGTAPNLTYTPAANYNGSDSFTFKVNDGTATRMWLLCITVTPIGDAPIANDQSITTPEDVAKAITLVGSDPDGNAITYIIVSGPSHGTLSGTAPNVTYTPTANYNGPDSFTFKVNDGTSDSNIATVSITVTPVGDAPVASNQSITTPEDVAKAFTLVASDPDGDALTYIIISGPSHGTLSGTAPNLTYTPTANYNGSDSFTFKVNDGTSDSNVATVSITVTPVGDAPIANNQSVTTPEDVAKAITLVGSDPDGDAITYIIVSGPSHGTLSGTAPNVTYTPTANYNGADSFTFKVNDGTSDSNIATVSITVTPVGDAPIASSQSITTPEDVAKAFTLIASDPDGDALTYIITTPPTHGTLSGTAPNLTYTPDANYNGSDSFKFRANDGTSNSNSATVSITVTPVGDAPIANNQSVTTPEDVAKAITLVGSDPDGDAITYSIVSGPAHGTLSGAGANITYTPTLNYTGADSFTFKVNDGTSDSNVATVTITVTPVNDAPIANNQSVNYDLNTAKGITLTGSDPDGDPITFTILTLPLNGTLTGTAPNVTYTPGLNYSGSDSFTFKVNDGTTDSNIATVSLSLTLGGDVPPVSFDQSVNVVEDTPTLIILSATDDNGDPLTYTIVSGPSNGTLSGTGANVTYTPSLNYNGSDSFTFKVNDGTTDSNISTVSITVTPVNDAPVAADQSISSVEEVPTNITLVGTDVEGDPLTYEIVTGPTAGILTGSGANLSYMPNDFSGLSNSDSFTFRVYDGSVYSNTATVTINILPDDDVPVAYDLAVSTPEDTPRLITISGADKHLEPITYIVITLPTHGTLTGTAPSLTYSPDANYTGADSFTFKVNDGTSDSNIATVSITVTPVGDAPIADNQSVTTAEDVAKAITLTGSDPDADPITFTLVSLPSHGTLSGTAPNITYTLLPLMGYFGSDSFTFKVNDGTSDSNVATVSITVTPVSDSPTASDQSNTPEDVAKAITLGANDPDGDALTYTIVSAPTHGTLTGSGANVTIHQQQTITVLIVYL